MTPVLATPRVIGEAADGSVVTVSWRGVERVVRVMGRYERLIWARFKVGDGWTDVLPMDPRTPVVSVRAGLVSIPNEGV
jgi:hypothetical protein